MQNFLLQYEKHPAVKSIFDSLINIEHTVKLNHKEILQNEHHINTLAKTLTQSSKKLRKAQTNLKNIDAFLKLGRDLETVQYGCLIASHYTNSGKLKVEISNELTEQLFDTNLNKIYMNDIVIPFNSFYLPLKNVSITTDTYGKKAINGAYVVKSDQTLEIVILTNDTNFNFLTCHYPLKDNQEINTLIKKHSHVQSSEYTNETLISHFHNGSQMSFENTNIQINEVSHLVFSILLYLTSFWIQKKDNIELSYDYDNLLRKKHTKSNQKKLLRSKAVTENIIYLKSKNETKKNNYISTTDKQIRNMFLVRGHWRKQPVGLKTEKKTKLIWIKPFWKGEGEIQGKSYKVA